MRRAHSTRASRSAAGQRTTTAATPRPEACREQVRHVDGGHADREQQVTLTGLVGGGRVVDDDVAQLGLVLGGDGPRRECRRAERLEDVDDTGTGHGHLRLAIPTTEGPEL